MFFTRYFIATCALLSLLWVAFPAMAGTVSAKSTLPRGSIIQASDLKVEPSVGQSPEEMLNAYVGKELKRTVAAGYRLNPAYVGKPVTVRRNARVSMIYKAGALEITAWGRALEEGGVGDVITIMNLGSRKKIQGRILDTGVIEVGL